MRHFSRKRGSTHLFLCKKIIKKGLGSPKSLLEIMNAVVRCCVKKKMTLKNEPSAPKKVCMRPSALPARKTREAPPAQRAPTRSSTSAPRSPTRALQSLFEGSSQHEPVVRYWLKRKMALRNEPSALYQSYYTPALYFHERGLTGENASRCQPVIRKNCERQTKLLPQHGKTSPKLNNFFPMAGRIQKSDIFFHSAPSKPNFARE